MCAGLPGGGLHNHARSRHRNATDDLERANAPTGSLMRSANAKRKLTFGERLHAVPWASIGGLGGAGRLDAHEFAVGLRPAIAKELPGGAHLLNFV
jgi:hypothetical protein